MKFKPLVLDDQALFNSYTKGRKYRQADASFANLYIWQHDENIEIAEADDALFVSSKNRELCPYLLPPFLKDSSQSIAPYMEMAEKHMADQGCAFYMRFATKEMVDKIQKDCPDQYDFVYDRDNSEYIYNTSDLAGLPGKHYHGKRNHISAFLRSHEPIVQPYTDAFRDSCMVLQDEWAETQQDDRIRADEEYISVMKALDNHEALGLKGIVVLLDGEVAAFTFGEQLTDDTALIHIEKAKHDENGLFAYINREFVRRAWPETAYINREEDMGDPGLRRAKTSYHPAFLVDKYDVVRRAD